jgi:hypothetical protein
VDFFQSYVRLKFDSFAKIVAMHRRTGLIIALVFTGIAGKAQHNNMTRQEYIDTYKSIAMEEMQRTGIPASITLGQGILESGDGNSKLARKANNHFGIKCHDNWNGRRIRHDDDARNECFRRYKNPEESYKDHSDFLTGTSRYAFLFKLDPEDYKDWAKGLKKAGYATSPTYARRLIDIIEANQLYKYDQQVIAAAGTKSFGKNRDEIVSDAGEYKQVSNQRRIFINNRVKYIIVKDGDTFDKLASEFDKLSWELPKYNEMAEDSQLVAGEWIYLQPKRNKAEAGKKFYIVQKGETMYSISQRFGIKLEKLYEKNLMSPGTEPQPGQKLSLRKRLKNNETANLNLPKRVLKRDDSEDNSDEKLKFEFDDLKN